MLLFWANAEWLFQKEMLRLFEKRYLYFINKNIIHNLKWNKLKAIQLGLKKERSVGRNVTCYIAIKICSKKN